MNKNKQCPEHPVQIYDNCIDCNDCLEQCNEQAIVKGDGDKKVIIDLDKCVGCGLCKEACGADAIEMVPDEEEA